MIKFLITGFSGFVSRHFCEFLENNGIRCSIKGIDVFAPDFKTEHFRCVKVAFEKSNLLNKNKVENIIYNFQPDYILHLASLSSVAFSWSEPILSFQNNTNIFLNLLEAIRKLNISTRILSVGSSEEYGNVQAEDMPLTEAHPLRPISPYAVARVSQELLSQVYAEGYGIDIIMTRSFNHIGPYQKDVFVLPSFVKQLVELKNKGISSNEIIAGDTTIIRDFTDVRDVVAAYYLLLTRGEKGEVYNVCSGKGWSLKEIIDMICNYLGVKVLIKTDPSRIRINDNKIIIGSNQKIALQLQWEIKYSLEQSIKDMICYWEAQY